MLFRNKDSLSDQKQQIMKMLTFDQFCFVCFNQYYQLLIGLYVFINILNTYSLTVKNVLKIFVSKNNSVGGGLPTPISFPLDTHVLNYF